MAYPLPVTQPLRVVFTTDQMQDVRMIEGLADFFDLTILTPRSRAGTVSTWRATGRFEKRVLPGGRAGFVLRSAIWLVRHRDAYGVVIAQDNLAAALGANIARIITGRPVIIRLGRTTIEYFRCRRLAGQGGIGYWVGLALVTALVNLNERLATAVGATSKYIAADSSRRSRFVRVIPAYGVDTEVFSPTPSREEARENLDLPQEVPLILFRSRIAPEKDPVTFMKAMAKLREQGVEALGLYVGGEFRDLERLARTFDVPILARDAVHPRELPLYYRASNMVVQTSRAEGFGLSPVEALACEVPVVASAVGGLMETIVNGQTGVSVPPSDVDATAQGIRWVLEHPAEALVLAKRGREMVSTSYTSKKAFDGWKTLAEDVASKKPGRKRRKLWGKD